MRVGVSPFERPMEIMSAVNYRPDTQMDQRRGNSDYCGGHDCSDEPFESCHIGICLIS
jgi:hypothetical protein